MNDNRVILDTAAFMSSAQAVSITDASTTDIREIARRYVAACYDDAGKAPRHLDGEDMAQVLTLWLPRHFGRNDPLTGCVYEVVSAFLRFLEETQVAFAMYEQRRALDEHIDAFAEAVRTGAAHDGGVAITGKGTTIRHRVEKTGRNDPCPCGSGAKFKKCCMQLGG